MITLDNYEGWLMRYIDGALSSEQREAVEMFLAEHPEMREEMEEVASVRVTPVVATMPNKERLMKTVAARTRLLPPSVLRRIAAAVVLLLTLGGIALLLPRQAVHAPLTAQKAGNDVQPMESSAPQTEKRKLALRGHAVAQKGKPKEVDFPSCLTETPALLTLEAEPAPEDAAITTKEEAVTPEPAEEPKMTVRYGVVIDNAQLAENVWQNLFMALNY